MSLLPPVSQGLTDIPFGPDPLLPLLALLRQDPRQSLPALLAPLPGPPSSGPLWSISVPGLRLPLLFSIPDTFVPVLTSSGQRLPGRIFESDHQLFFQADAGGKGPEPLLLLVESLPIRQETGEMGGSLSAPVGAAGEALERWPEKRVSDEPSPGPVESQFLKSGEVQTPPYVRVSGPFPVGVASPGGAPPSVELEIRWPDREERGPSPLEGGSLVSFRLSVSYKNRERLDLIGVYDPSRRKLSLFPRSSSASLLGYWNRVEGDLRRACAEGLSVLLEGGASPPGALSGG